MGDWLETGKAFGGDVKNVIAEIKKRGLKPALWVAPFIASADSKLFQEHPDWFVKGEDGKPLCFDKVGFGGWRQGPWYCLDGSNREAQRHLTALFKTLSEDWGVEYFKLDANYWGAIHSGQRSDKKATRIEAYREGMEAILRGAGNAFILGCNHPMWGSLGLIDGSRSSMDIERSWESIARTGRQNLLRAWQNGRLWWNDPDCLLLSDNFGGFNEQERSFHVALIHATGGMLLSSDDLARLPLAQRKMLEHLASLPRQTLRFDDELARGTAPSSDPRTGLPATLYVLLNWTGRAVVQRFPIPGRSSMENLLDSDKPYATVFADGGHVLEVPPRSGRIVRVTTGLPSQSSD